MINLGKSFLCMVIVPVTLALVTSGCATKKFVRSQVSPVNQRVSQLERQTNEQIAAPHPRHRQHAAGEVEHLEHRADGADPLQVDEDAERGEPERQPDGGERWDAQHGVDQRALPDRPLPERALQ